MHSFDIIIDIVPIGKGRAQHVRKGTFTTTYTPKKTREFEQEIKLACLKHICEIQYTNPFIRFERFVHIEEFTAIMPIPKSTTKKVRELIAQDPQHLKKPDVDNILKAVLDGMSGVVYRDDCIISKIRNVDKNYGATPCLIIRLKGE